MERFSKITKIDWPAAEHEYVTRPVVSIPSLAEELGVSRVRMYEQAKVRDWDKKRNRFWAKVSATACVGRAADAVRRLARAAKVEELLWQALVGLPTGHPLRKRAEELLNDKK